MTNDGFVGSKAASKSSFNGRKMPNGDLIFMGHL